MYITYPYVGSRTERWLVEAAWISIRAAFLCALILWSAQLRAEVAADVYFVGGLVTATAGGAAKRELAKGGDIYDIDEVSTAYNGRVQMRFTDGGLVSLMPNTTFTVEEYRLGAGNGEAGALIFGLLRGGMRTVTGAIGKAHHDNYQLKTPVGTLGIRGTEFIVVIGPPGTLRVHVGRGKVVITNSHGSLEVPTGQNAVVTLGAAPMLSEEAPVFLAISPVGDRDSLLGMVREDPQSVELPVLTSVQPAQQFLSSGPGYFMSVIKMRPITGVPDTRSGWPGYATFDTGNGALTSFADAAFPTQQIDFGGAGAATPLYQSTVAGLNWGALSNGSITIQGSSYAFAPGNADPAERSLPYISGLAATAPLSGLLSFSLPPGVSPPAYANTGDVGTLDQFNFGINVGALTYTLDFKLNMPSAAYSATGATGTMGSLYGPTFSFANTLHIDQGGSPCSTCALNASGFVTTSDSAGVAYSLHDNTTVITGVAPLVPPGWTPPVSSPGMGM